MTENEAQCRVTFSEELSQVVRHAKETNFEHLLGGDELWFYYKYRYDSAWAPSRAIFRFGKHRKFRRKMPGSHYLVDVKHPQSPCFACRDAVQCGVLLCICSALPDIERSLCDGKRREALRGVYLHLNDTPIHSAKRSQKEIARTKATRDVHLDYSPDATSNHFFLFGYLKGEMGGFTVNSPANILSEIRWIFQKISKETLAAVYDE
jgi:hypothetical protein